MMENVRMFEKVIFFLNLKKFFFDLEFYYVFIFGIFLKDKIWVWSFEGYYIFINIILVNGYFLFVILIFYGVVLIVVLKGEYKGFQVFKDSLMVLKDEENLVKEIVEFFIDD